MDSFFLLKDGVFKKYYPIQKPFSIFKNEVNKLTLKFVLPEKHFSYLKYDLHFVSKTDTAQNAMVRIFSDYRVGG